MSNRRSTAIVVSLLLVLGSPVGVSATYMVGGPPAIAGTVLQQSAFALCFGFSANQGEGFGGP